MQKEKEYRTHIRQVEEDYRNQVLKSCYGKGKMKQVSAAYKSEFVIEFKDACAKLGISPSEVISEAMRNTIKKAHGRQ